MSRAKDREEFIAIMATEGVPIETARALLRAGATLHRLAELECSSEAADRDRVRCPQLYASSYVSTCLCRGYGSFDPALANDPATYGHGTVPRIAVQGARVEARVVQLCAPYKIKPIFHGDPRGAVLKLIVPSGRTNDMGREGICVP